jgi:hypothetical protein
VYVICVCLHIVMSNTYCIVFLFCFSSSSMLQVSLDCLFLIPLWVLSNVYLINSGSILIKGMAYVKRFAGIKCILQNFVENMQITLNY